ncbi:hypothetical protein PIB30_017696 [Stylosanthes scabra]|uniref:Uncharacterized protein n=1 Tax=Stylosanthes scabra TaxID=79078 RepID=A0ABU6Q7I0_9FABA|nr:hypothetical protein [Stylosanthes scabra]
MYPETPMSVPFVLALENAGSIIHETKLEVMGRSGAWDRRSLTELRGHRPSVSGVGSTEQLGQSISTSSSSSLYTDQLLHQASDLTPNHRTSINLLQSSSSPSRQLVPRRHLLRRSQSHLVICSVLQNRSDLI